MIENRLLHEEKSRRDSDKIHVMAFFVKIYLLKKLLEIVYTNSIRCSIDNIEN